MSMDDEASQPPEAPEIERRFKLHRAQLIGVPILLLLPVLALVGVFGEARQTLSTGTSEISATVEYTTRHRHSMLNRLLLDVSNTTAATLDTVTVEIDTTYVSRSSDVTAIPSFEYPYTIQLTDLHPGETRKVHVEYHSHRYGPLSGELRVSSGGADTARLALSTFIFP